ncbi:hypothetical protein MAIT1_05040 [Magnetofaba australis IT-1]|uniref:Uncharacterized protein n=1 Tax=Magnetofaba australis IT-1 TaxID=1434232 RepID=A0A1Y2K839_9PROT|nr:hypothetical protein MAIT1_05040 [Magnetofaba australis IT-1]
MTRIMTPGHHNAGIALQMRHGKIERRRGDQPHVQHFGAGLLDSPTQRRRQTGRREAPIPPHGDDGRLARFVAQSPGLGGERQPQLLGQRLGEFRLIRHAADVIGAEDVIRRVHQRPTPT